MQANISIFFQVNSDLNDLELVLSKFDSIKPSEIADRCWLECQLALAEGFTNAVRHAHHCKPKNTPIDIEVIINCEAMTIKVWDYGQPFNLLKQVNVLASQSKDLQPVFVGGRGLMIIDRVADKLSYERIKNDRNCLVIYKRIASSLIINDEGE